MPRGIKGSRYPARIVIACPDELEQRFLVFMAKKRFKERQSALRYLLELADTIELAPKKGYGKT